MTARACDAYTDLYTVTTEILTDAVDVNGTFNTIRDAFYNSTGGADPMVDMKIQFATAGTEEVVRLGQVYNKVTFNAPKPIVSHATQLYQSVATVAQMTTEPMAEVVALQAAGKQLTIFMNAYRAHHGDAVYGGEDAQVDSQPFLGLLQQQAEEFMEETMRKLKEAGYTSTPWGQPR